MFTNLLCNLPCRPPDKRGNGTDRQQNQRALLDELPGKRRQILFGIDFDTSRDRFAHCGIAEVHGRSVEGFGRFPAVCISKQRNNERKKLVCLLARFRNKTPTRNICRGAVLRDKRLFGKILGDGKSAEPVAQIGKRHRDARRRDSPHHDFEVPCDIHPVGRSGDSKRYAAFRKVRFDGGKNGRGCNQQPRKKRN